MLVENQDQQTPALDPELQAEANRLKAAATLADQAPDPAAQALADQAAQAADQVRAQTVGVLHMGLAPVFNIAAPNWKLTPAEVNMLAQAYADVLLVYFPGGLGDMGPWAGVVITTAAVFGPRIGVPRKLEEQANTAEGAAVITATGGQ